MFNTTDVPKSSRIPKLVEALYANIKRVRAPRFNGIQLIFQPQEGKFRECLTSSRCDRAASDDQFIVTNDDRNITENVSWIPLKRGARTRFILQKRPSRS